MAAPQPRCSICRSMLDEEDLFCSNCGTEGPVGLVAESSSLDQQASVLSFKCDSCGASMSYDASAQALRCPFCGGERLSEQKDARTLKPNWVVPFQVDRVTAERALREFLQTGFWRPGDASEASLIHDVTQVYIPFWVFWAKTSTRWTGDSNDTPPGARSDWYPKSGEHRQEYSGLLVVASSTLTSVEVDRISPFDLRNSVDPTTVDLLNVIVEEFRLPRKYARPLAKGLIEQLEAVQCAQYLGSRSRNVQVNVEISEMKSEPVLLPIWIMVYRYQDHPYRVLINGQTAKIAGAAPFSYKKLGMVVMIVLAVVALIVVLVMLFAVLV